MSQFKNFLYHEDLVGHITLADCIITRACRLQVDIATGHSVSLLKPGAMWILNGTGGVFSLPAQVRTTNEGLVLVLEADGGPLLVFFFNWWNLGT